MAYPRSCSKHACIHVLLASFIMLAVAVAAEAPLPDVPLSAPLHFSLDAHKYLMEVFVDRRKFRAVADTGSSLTWLRPPRQQMSSNTLDCSKCTGSSSCKCDDDEGKHCSFDIHYGGGSHERGSMFTEKLSFHSEKHNADDNKELAIGWSEDTYTYDGVVGLGRGKQSLVKQLGQQTLSYCLATHTDDKAGGDQKSKLIVGGAHSADAIVGGDQNSACQPSCKVHTTSLLRPDEEFYYVHLKSIKIGRATTIPLPKVNAGKSSERTANMFIDSGAYLTTLEQEAYKKVVDYVNKAMPKTAVKVAHNNTVCWSDGDPNKQGSLQPKLEAFELHFAGENKRDAVLDLKKDQILYDDGKDEEERKRVCLAFKERHPEKKPTGVSVLGNLHQQNLLMHFDISEGKNKLSFVRVDDCAKVNI